MTAAATLSRRLVQTYWLEAWMGANLDQRLYCPGAVFGVSFDVDNSDDTSPYTPEEVRTEVGWVRLKMDEVDRWRDRTSSGVEGGTMMAGFFRLWNLQFAIRTPEQSDLAIGEGYADAIEALFDGLSIRHDGPPTLSLRNIGQYPTRRRGPITESPWQTLFLDVKMRCRERRALQGAQEVTL